MSAPQVVVTGVGTAIRGVGLPTDLLHPDRSEVHDDPVASLSGRGMRFRDRATRLAIRAADDALSAADIGSVAADRMGVVASSNFGNVEVHAATIAAIAAGGYRATSPMTLPTTAGNVIPAMIAIRHDLRGPNIMLSNGSTSGLDAVEWGRLLLTVGRLDAVVVVGVEPADPAVLALLGTAGAPHLALDGAGALVLETSTAATRRGVRGLATLRGYARAAEHQQAITRAGIEPGAHVGLWCGPDRLPRYRPPSDHELHLASALGRCSGALGVLQCVAATVWLDRGSDGPVLVTAGTGDGDDDASAATVLEGTAR